MQSKLIFDREIMIMGFSDLPWYLQIGLGLGGFFAIMVIGFSVVRYIESL